MVGAERFDKLRDLRRAVPLFARVLLCADLQRSEGMGSPSNPRPLLLTFDTGPQVVLKAFGACHHAADSSVVALLKTV